MASFMLDFAAITPALEIISSFQSATDEEKSPTGSALGDTNSSMETLLGSLRDSITSCSSPEVAIPHQLFSFISPADRPNAWKKLLGVPEQNGDEYAELCQRDAMEFDAKIRDDAFRTFKGNTEFWARVDEATIIRVLKALSVQFGYVQGMNVLLGPFLYIMSEEESYLCMKTLLQDHIPRYVLKNLDGAQSGSKLFARALQALDAKLYHSLTSKMPDLSIFALRYVLTLFANSKPLDEVLKLWDATFAVGPHFNIMLLCAKLMLLRDSILKEKRASKILTIIEDSVIVSKTLIDGAFCLLRFLPASLLEELTAHATGLAPLPLPLSPTRALPPLLSARSTASAQDGEAEEGGARGERGAASPLCLAPNSGNSGKLQINSAFSVSHSQSCDSPAPTGCSNTSHLGGGLSRGSPALLTPSPLSSMHGVVHASFLTPTSATLHSTLHAFGAFASHDTDRTDHTDHADLSSGSLATTPVPGVYVPAHSSSAAHATHAMHAHVHTVKPVPTHLSPQNLHIHNHPHLHTTHTTSTNHTTDNTNNTNNTNNTTHPANNTNTTNHTTHNSTSCSGSGTARTSPSSSANSSSCNSMDDEDEVVQGVQPVRNKEVRRGVRVSREVRLNRELNKEVNREVHM